MIETTALAVEDSVARFIEIAVRLESGQRLDTLPENQQAFWHACTLAVWKREETAHPLLPLGKAMCTILERREAFPPCALPAVLETLVYILNPSPDVAQDQTDAAKREVRALLPVGALADIIEDSLDKISAKAGIKTGIPPDLIPLCHTAGKAALVLRIAAEEERALSEARKRIGSVLKSYQKSGLEKLIGRYAPFLSRRLEGLSTFFRKTAQTAPSPKLKRPRKIGQNGKRAAPGR